MTSRTEGQSVTDNGGVPVLVKYDARLRENMARNIVEEVNSTVEAQVGGKAPPGGKAAVGSTPKSFPRVALDLATTVERIQQNFVICDPSLPDCPIVFASDAFLDLTEYRREDVLGRNWWVRVLCVWGGCWGAAGGRQQGQRGAAAGAAGATCSGSGSGARGASLPARASHACLHAPHPLLPSPQRPHPRACAPAPPRPARSRFLQGPDTDPKTVDAIREAVRAQKELTVRILNYTKSGRPFWNMFTLAPMSGALAAAHARGCTRQPRAVRRGAASTRARGRRGSSAPALACAHACSSLLLLAAAARCALLAARCRWPRRLRPGHALLSAHASTAAHCCCCALLPTAAQTLTRPRASLWACKWT